MNTGGGRSTLSDRLHHGTSGTSSTWELEIGTAARSIHFFHKARPAHSRNRHGGNDQIVLYHGTPGQIHF